MSEPEKTINFNKQVLNKLNEGERSLVDWQFGQCGGFYHALWQAIVLADKENLAKLELGFPKYVNTYRRYKHEKGWWDALKKRLESAPLMLVRDDKKQGNDPVEPTNNI